MDIETLTKNYTNALLLQCTNIEEQIDLDPDYLRLITIQATYNTFKHHVSKLNDLKTQKQIFKVFECDAQSLVAVKEPTVDYVGNS